MLKQLRRGRGWMLSLTLCCGAAAVLWLSGAAPAPTAAAQDGARPVYHSPVDVKYSPSGALIAVSDRTAGALAIVDAASGKLLRTAPIGGKTGCVAWSPDSAKVYVTDYNNHRVAEVNAADAKVLRQIPAGAYPNGVAIAAKKGLLLVTNTGLHDLSVIDLASGKEKSKVKLVREPYTVAVAPDESVAVVSNLLPAGAASDPQITGCLSIVNLADLAVTNIKLPPNTGAMRTVAIGPDGKWAYVVHTVGRTTLPATQLDRGWVNTNALSIIDLKEKKHFATLLLDSLAEGAADPWGIALNKDASVMWISISGTHQLAKIDLAGLHKNLAGGDKPAAAAPAGAAPAAPAKKVYSSPIIWDEIKADPAKRADLVNDLSALYVANLITRYPMPGQGPRGIDVSPDGAKVAVSQYFTGNVAMVDAATGKVPSCVSIGEQPAMDLVRRGEFVFHDGGHTFQKWLACATCHPNEGRVDAMNWDLTNDGIGNPKNNKSLVHVQETGPAMWLSVREDADEAIMAGFRFNSQVPSAESLKATQAYIKSLRPDPSPYLVGGKLSEKAVRGKKLFEDETVGCAHCHSGTYFTNQKKFNVGTHGSLDHPGEDTFDTPSLIECWRTAPYLHDGRAANLVELFTKHNPGDKHGKTAHLKPNEIEDLVEYLLSL